MLAGTGAVQELGRLANEHRPVLHTHDRYGQRIDVVEYHPAYHDLMRTSLHHGLHSGPWADPRPGAHVARAGKIIVWYQVDAGHICPVSMTYAVVPALRHQPEVDRTWEPMICSTTYDPDNRPAAEKAGVTCGMALTEKQGGSDVRANTTRAVPLGGDDDGTYRLTGHKWFCSAPMSDAFLMLAQAPGGISCFLVPRWKPDGTRNPIRIQRLKDKLGDRSNASSEIELLDVWGQLIGEEGRGVRTIIEMVNHTRLDCILGSTAIMRQGVAQATWHAAHRFAFGKLLASQPLMANVLADLAVESEAATVAALRLARAFDAEAGDDHEFLLQRLLTPIVKYWTCKRAPQHAAESLECLGGNGYVEESGMPRLFRQSPVNGVWEGSGNVICLDVLRALAREPSALDAYWSEVGLAGGGDAASGPGRRRSPCRPEGPGDARAPGPFGRGADGARVPGLPARPVRPRRRRRGVLRVATGRRGRHLRDPAGRIRHRLHPGPAYTGVMSDGAPAVAPRASRPGKAVERHGAQDVVDGGTGPE